MEELPTVRQLKKPVLTLTSPPVTLIQAVTVTLILTLTMMRLAELPQLLLMMMGTSMSTMTRRMRPQPWRQ